MNRALIRITPELLAEALRLPADTTVIGADWDVKTHSVIIAVVAPQLPLVMPEHQAPYVTYSVRSEWNL